MEILDAAEVCFMSAGDLLDFGLDGEAEKDFDPKASYSSSSSFTAAEAAAFCDESLSGSFLEFAEEEELEWLSNKYEFPSVETCFGILSDNPELIMQSHHSPSSVLENSFSNGNGATSKSVGSPSKTTVGLRSKGRKRRIREDYAELWSSQVTFEDKRETGGVARVGRRCLHCQSDRTPQWRAGPLGPKTLCNACGVRYKSGRLLPEYRPATSPTFSSELHSNSHRRVVEMRRAMEGENHGS